MNIYKKMKRFSCGGDNNTTQQDHNILLDIKDHTYTKKTKFKFIENYFHGEIQPPCKRGSAFGSIISFTGFTYVEL